MEGGLVLVVFGAILTFAVRTESPNVDIQTVGLILMVAGGVIIWHKRRDDVREHKVIRVEESDDGPPKHTVTETVIDRDKH